MGPLHIVFELPNSQIFDDTLLNLFEVVVVFVEDGLCFANIQMVLSADAPRNVEQRLQVRTRDAVLAGRRLHHAQALELLTAHFLNFLRKVSFFDSEREVVKIAALSIEFTKLLFDRFELLAQVVLALVLVDFFFDLALDLVGNPQALRAVVPTRSQTVLSRSLRFTVSKIACFSSVEMSMFAATKSHNWPGSLTPSTIWLASFGISGMNFTTCFRSALQVHEQRFRFSTWSVPANSSSSRWSKSPEKNGSS